MFNIFAFEKKLVQDEELKKLKEEFVAEEKRRKVKQNKLVNNYNKRIENFVVHMGEKPVITQDVAPIGYRIREEDPARFIGPANIKIRSFKHEKDRIREAIERNKEYRADGSAIQFEFRKRDTTREIQPQMHFTTKSNLERVVERIQDHMVSQSENTRTLSDMPEAFFAELSKTPKLMNQYLARQVMPELNVKTYFKAAKTLAYALPSPPREAKPKVKPDPTASPTAKSPKVNFELGPASPKSHGLESMNSMPRFMKSGSSPMRRNETSVGFDEERSPENKQQQADKQNTVEVVDPAEASRKVLLTCNITKEKPSNSHNLKRGEGHLIGMSDISVAEIYRSVYNRSIDPRMSV